MEPKEIKIALIRKEIDQSTVARQLGVSPSIVQRVIHRKAVSRRVSQGIADALCLDLHEVFPELYERRRAACN